MIARLLHVVAIAALIGSAGYAYTVKYDATFYAEQVAKLKQRAKKERDAIAVLKAEWQRLARPDRLQALAERHLDLQPLAVNQITRLSDLPAKQPKTDEIARKLEALGLFPTETPRTTGSIGSTSTSTTPGAAARRPAAGAQTPR